MTIQDALWASSLPFGGLAIIFALTTAISDHERAWMIAALCSAAVSVALFLTAVWSGVN